MEWSIHDQVTASRRQTIPRGQRLSFVAFGAAIVEITPSDTPTTKLLERDGKVYRARLCLDDGIACLVWYPSDEVTTPLPALSRMKISARGRQFLAAAGAKR
jgi:hypothetical protein